MSSRPSIKDADGLVWTTAGIPIGVSGLDLRRSDAPSTLSKLINARFLDSKTVMRRDGHEEKLVQDGANFVQDKIVREWVYGHGRRLEIPTNSVWDNAHHPIHNRGAGGFSLDTTDVVWTGDRLLVETPDDAFQGASTFWDRGGGHLIKAGHPAYLPVQTDSFLPSSTGHGYMDTVLSDTQRLALFTNDDSRLVALTIDRITGTILDRSFVGSGDDGDVSKVRAIWSDGVFVALFMNEAGLQISYWNGTGWAAPSVIDSDAVTYDVATVDNGFHLVWRTGGVVYATKFSGHTAVQVPYAANSVVPLLTAAASGQVAVAVAPDGSLAIVMETTVDMSLPFSGLCTYTLTYQLEVSSPAPRLLDAIVAWNGGLSACFRGLRNEDGYYPYVVHVSKLASECIVKAWELVQSSDATVAPTILQSATTHNSLLTSKGFRVGDEVFAWYMSTNSDTNYLMGGVSTAQRCGIADRETALSQLAAAIAEPTFLAWPFVVHPDPLDSTRKFTWMRGYNAGVYSRPSNTLIGDLDFLPNLSTAKFGRSVYLAGSLVRTWDGTELGDAGFHDYPVLKSSSPATGGNLTLLATYSVRVYATRWNNQGEKFSSVALAATLPALTASNNKITITVKTVPITNHAGVILEVYRTAGNGAFYLEGTVVNDLSEDDVTFDLTMSDATLRTKLADPRGGGVGTPAQLDEFGPLGCSVLVTAGDRLWGIGGQVGHGVAEFSKLWVPGSGAGFDSLGGNLQVLDATGGTITSLAAFADSVVVAFQPDRVYVLAGNGPDNTGAGAYDVPQLLLEGGTATHRGTISLPVGVVFWGAEGPRLLTAGFKVETIGEPVGPLAAGLDPSGVTANLARREVVWYTESGVGLLWSYQDGSRWAQWTGLPVAGVSDRRLVTPDGRSLAPSSTPRDGGRRYQFGFATGNVRPEALLMGSTRVRRVGLLGEHRGEHNARFRVYYDGSRLWSERFTWEPTVETWLAPGIDFSLLTPAEIDALACSEHSGAYGTNRRLARQVCRFLRVEVSDGGDDGFIPWELSFELGQTPGLGRTAVNTFTGD